MWILIIAAIVSTVINMLTEEDKSIGRKSLLACLISLAWIDGAAILSAVVICTLVAAVNDYEKEKQFIALNKVAEDSKQVISICTFASLNAPSSPSSEMARKLACIRQSSLSEIFLKSKRE